MGIGGVSAITAITAQNSIGVVSVHPVEAATLSAQLDALLGDIHPGAIKIGMLGGTPQVLALISIFKRKQYSNIVLDPVLISTSGASLLDNDGKSLLKRELIPYCTLVTPNLREASELSGIEVKDSESMIQAGHAIIAMGANAVLVKGGHLRGLPTDWLIQKNGPTIELTGQRIYTEHSHGTGCLLSSAIAAGLANGLSLVKSVMNAKTFLTEALKHPIVLGHGRGYADVLNVSAVISTRPARSHKDRIALFKGLYVVTDPILQGGRSHMEIACAAFAGGAQIVQLRDKTLPLPELILQAKDLSKLAKKLNKLFIVNDRVDVALASDADGVHLGPDDISPADARSLLGPDKLVGVSTGTVDEAIAASPFASYFGIGAIYGSLTKTDAGDPISPKRITEIKSLYPSFPVVAIGGINAENIAPVISAGADSVAVVSAVVAAKDITAAASQLAAFMA